MSQMHNKMPIAKRTGRKLRTKQRKRKEFDKIRMKKKQIEFYLNRHKTFEK